MNGCRYGNNSHRSDNDDDDELQLQLLDNDRKEEMIDFNSTTYSSHQTQAYKKSLFLCEILIQQKLPKIFWPK